MARGLLCLVEIVQTCSCDAWFVMFGRDCADWRHGAVARGLLCLVEIVQTGDMEL